MPRKSKSLFRAPDAQHFQLVHRSQRDPLAHDADASQRVFKPVERINNQRRRPPGAGGDVVTLHELEREVMGKGKGRAAALRANEGEAAEYGVYYDDTSYDYMQHLRPVGDGAAGVEESFLISMPKRGEANASGVYQGRSKDKGTRRTRDDDDERGGIFRKPLTLPSDVLASADEITREQAYAQQAAVPAELQGLRPDMDPHLRQVLEALDDDAFVAPQPDDELQDDEDWLNELISGGERDVGEGDRLPFEFAEWGVDADGRPLPAPSRGDEDDDDDARTEQGEESWEDRFREFKQSGGAWAAREDAASEAGCESYADDHGSEAADTVGSLPALSVVGGKRRRRKDGSDASGYSMSSSSMFRNKGLSTLDEMFDKVEADYERDDDDDEEDDGWDESASFADGMMSESGMSSMSAASNSTFARALRSAVDAGPPEISREDFDGIMDDFLENYEVVGNKMVGRLAGETGADKLHTIRRSLLEEMAGEDTTTDHSDAEWIRKRFLKEDDEDAPPQEDLNEHEWIRSASERPKDRWDVDTILTTRTNVENHPRMIGGSSKPNNNNNNKAKRPPQPLVEDDSETASDATETEETARRATVSRPKGESADDKRARKAAVKAERQARRVEKRSRQEIFAGERRKQVGQHARRVGAGGAADVSLAALDRKMNVVSLD